MYFNVKGIDVKVSMINWWVNVNESLTNQQSVSTYSAGQGFSESYSNLWICTFSYCTVYTRAVWVKLFDFIGGNLSYIRTVYSKRFDRKVDISDFS